METKYVSLGVILVILGAILTFTMRRLSTPDFGPQSVNRLRGFSLDRYRPMQRLLDTRDIEYLQVHPGFDRELEKLLRKQRTQVLRMYLRSLRKDFQVLHAVIRFRLAHSLIDSPDVALAVLKQSVTFWAVMTSVQLRLFLFEWNLARTPVPVGSLIDMAARMQRQLALAGAAQPVMA